MNHIASETMSPHVASTEDGGTLVLVVGPSGVGKDSVLAWAQHDLADRSDVIFARRTITRRADAGGENHIAATPEAFEQTERSGGFLLSWRSHGLAYGLPIALLEDLKRGCVVVANGSRAVLPAAAQVWPRLLVAHIVAHPGVIAARLAARGRESATDIEQRLSHAPALVSNGVPVVEVSNNGPLSEAGRRLSEIITAALEDGTGRMRP